MKNLYLAEYYDTDEDISFAWITASSKGEALRRLGNDASFSELIMMDEHTERCELVVGGDGSVIELEGL